MISGYEAEDLFKATLRKRGCTVVHANKEQNMFGHFDFIVDGQKVEVKSEKALNRGENTAPIFWIEAINVRGDRGWLFGESDKIAFLHNGEFWMVKTETLREYVDTNIPGYRKPTSVKGYKRWYRRFGRQDSVTYVYPRNILPMVVQKLKIDL